MGVLNKLNAKDTLLGLFLKQGLAMLLRQASNLGSYCLIAKDLSGVQTWGVPCIVRGLSKTCSLLQLSEGELYHVDCIHSSVVNPNLTLNPKGSKGRRSCCPTVHHCVAGFSTSFGYHTIGSISVSVTSFFP